MITNTYTFNTSGDFNKTNTVVAGGLAKLGLIPNPGQIFSQSFTSDTGFTYDSTKAEFVAGILRQKDQRPADALFAANFELGFPSNWGATAVAVTPTQVGTPTISGGKLNCLGSEANTGIYYDHADIGLFTSGTVRFRFTPHYSGTPAANEGLLAIVDPVTPTGANRILFLHSASGGTFRVDLRDSANVLKLNLSGASGTMGAWSPTAGQEYILEFSIDASIGRVTLFIDGVLHSTSQTVGAFTRSNTATRLRLGSNTTYLPSDSKFDDVILFSTIQHTITHTPTYSVISYAYAGSKIDGPNFSYTGVGTVLSVDDGTASEVGSPRYIVGLQYWNGSAWAVSNGTYAQANDFATVLANLPTFDTGGGSVLPWSVVFTDTNTQSSIDSFSVEVTGEKYSPTGYLEPAQALNVMALLEYTATQNIIANTDIGLILKIDGVLTYWNGTAWVVSDGTPAQSNTVAEVDDNVQYLLLGANSTIYPRWLLSTSTNIDTPEVLEASVSYNFGAVDIPPETCLVYGYVKDASGNPMVGAKASISFNADANAYNGGGNNILMPSIVHAYTDENGYFSLDLVKSTELEPTAEYKAVITKGNAVISSGAVFEVPDAETKDITDIII